MVICVSISVWGGAFKMSVPSLPDDICLSLATALIQSRLDYSNSVLYGTSTSNLHKLQMVQNALARTITRSPRSVPISQLLSNLHWLSIHKRIKFKVGTLNYKVLTTQWPAYLYNIISYHQPSRSLRSSSQSLLGMLTRLARLETRKNFSVLSIEFLAIEKCDKQLDRRSTVESVV